jgi:hypothetical protein
MTLVVFTYARGVGIIVFGISSIFWVSVVALFLSGVFDTYENLVI